MAETEPPDRPPDHLPALPAPQPPPVLPPGMNADEYRRFQEFQRFQDYQRFVEQGGGTSGAVVPYGGTPLHGAAASSPPAQHDIAEQLAGVRQHLADLATTQAHINRTINPPLWRRILRSRLVHRLLWLVVIVIVGSVGVPLLIENVLGNHNNTDANGNLPLPKQESGTLASGPHDAVQDVYRFVAGNDPAEACHGFSLAAQFEFAQAAKAKTCKLAVSTLAAQVTDRNAYATPILTQLPTPEGRTDTISSCEFAVSGGPRLGTFTLTKQDVGWEITNYAAPAACPAPTSLTPPTS